MNIDIVDVVIPSHIKDINTLNLCIKYAKKNVININNIYVVSKEKLTDNAIWISESIFPFSLNDVCDIIGKHSKTCWYYAGLIQTTSALVIPNLVDNVLILDSDTMIIKPTKFIDNGIALFNVSSRDGTPLYYEHMNKLIPNLTQIYKYSGVTHHILIQKHILKDMFNKVETIHNKPFWKADIEVILQRYKKDPNTNNIINLIETGPGRFTTYELYFTYALKYFPQINKIRKLNSIMAYKGIFGVEGYPNNKLIPSKLNLGNNKIIIDHDINFDNIIDSMDYISSKSHELGYDTITFHNHTRDGHNKHIKINEEYINSI